jgi:hypothetical protein
MDTTRLRFLPLAGIVAVILWAVAILSIDAVRPAEVNSPADILAYYQQHGDRIEMAVFGYMLGSILFLIFVSALWNRLRAAEDSGGGLAPIAFAAGIATSICMLVMYGSDMEAARDNSKYGLTATTAEAYYFFGDFWWVGAMLMSAVMLGATGLIAIRTGALPRWLGWVSVVLAVPLLLPPIGNTVMFFLFPIWVILVSIMLTRTAPDRVSVHAPASLPAAPADAPA